MRLNDVTSGPVRALLSNVCLTAVALAIQGAGAATIKTTGTTSYTIDGLFYSKAALASQSFAPTHGVNGDQAVAGVGGYVQPANTTVYYTVALNGAGTVAVVQGSFNGQVPTLDPTKGVGSLAAIGTSAKGDGSVPNPPDGYTAIGIVKVTTDGSTTFTPGTTLLDAAGLAVAYFNVCLLPSARP